MHYLEKFYYKTIKHDLINKFIYDNTDKLPKLQKIILNFGVKTANVKQLSSSLLTLKLITNQKGTLSATKFSNISIKIRKGNPTGCKLILQKYNLFNIFGRIVLEIFPKLKNFNGFVLNRKLKKNSFSYELHDTFSFYELESHYYYFNNLPKLDITIVTNSKNKNELVFILKSFNFPFNN